MLPCFDDITALPTYGFVIDESEAEEDSDKLDFVTALDKTFAGRGLEGPLVLWTAVGASSPESQRLIISHSGGIALW